MLLTAGHETQEIVVEHANDYAGEVRDLSMAVRGLREPVYAWEPLDANMRVIDACYASHKSGAAQKI
jgi:predicted dehydrogenase